MSLPQQREAASRSGRRPSILGGIVRALLPLNILELLAQHPRHGLQIAAQIAHATDGAWTPSAGTLYPLLQRLEDDGLVVSEPQRSTGAPRRVYALTPTGRRARTRLRAELVGELEAAKRVVDEHLEALRSGLPLAPHGAAEMARALEDAR